MNKRLKCSVLLAICACLVALWAPGCARSAPVPEPPAHLRDSPAGQVLLRAIEAHGGWRAWTAAGAAEFDWEARHGTGGEAKVTRARVKLDLHGGRVRLEDVESAVVQAWDGSEAWTEPADAPLDAPARFVTRTEHFWFCLPWKLADPGVRLERLEDEERDGKRFERVRATYEPGVGDSPQDWYIYYFNAESALLEMVVFTVTFFGPAEGEGGFTPYYGEWGEYVESGGLKIASLRRFAAWNEGKPAAFEFQDRLLDVRVSDRALPDSTFARPSS